MELNLVLYGFSRKINVGYERNLRYEYTRILLPVKSDTVSYIVINVPFYVVIAYYIVYTISSQHTGTRQSISMEKIRIRSGYGSGF